MRRAQKWVDGAGLAAAGAAACAAGVALSYQPPVAAGLVAASAAAGFAYLAIWRFEWLTLAMIVARSSIEVLPGSLLPGPARPSLVLTAAYSAAAVVWLARNRRPGGWSPSLLTLAVGLVGGAAVLSAALSPVPAAAAEGAARWGFLAVLVPVLERLAAGSSYRRKLVAAIAAAAAMPIVFGAAQAAAAGPDALTGLARVSGTMSHPNTLGFFLVVTTLVVVGVAPALRARLAAPAWVMAAAGAGVLALTYSRTGYLAFAVGLVVMALVTRRRSLGILVVVAVGVAGLVPGVSARWQDVDEGVTLRGTPGNSLAWRVDYWDEVLAESSEYRVSGVGLGVSSRLTATGREPHNDFVRSLAELGVVGLAAFVAFLAALSATAIRAARRARTSFDLGLAAAASGVVAAYLIGSLTGNLMTQLIILWYVLAVVVVASAAGAGAADV